MSDDVRMEIQSGSSDLVSGYDNRVSKRTQSATEVVSVCVCTSRQDEASK